jgi:hypothetical protein
MDSPVAEGLTGLMQWSDPVIFDRLRDAYSRKVSDPVAAWRLARLHARVWRALISGETDTFQTLRGELIAALAEQGLDLECLADADSGTMTELLEIVIARFRRSQRVAKGYHLALMALAGRLTMARAA